MSSENWMIYEAYGYTGILVAEEAIRRGHKPVLAGCSAEGLVPLAECLGLDSGVVDLQDQEKLSKTVRDFGLVFLVAGPYVRTSAPIVHACLDVGANYVNIGAESMILLEIPGTRRVDRLKNSEVSLSIKKCSGQDDDRH